MWIDTHCHINCLSPFQIEEIVTSEKECLFIDSSVHYKSSLTSLELSRKHSFIYSALGFHPFWAKEFLPQTVKDYEALIDSSDKVVAIGEVGLDYKAELSLSGQEKVFSAFIELAKRRNLPLILHNRLDSFDILDILDRFFSSYEGIIFHCFSYSTKFLEKILEKRGFVSFSLNVLRKKPDIISSLKMCPLERLLLETDSPYMRIDGRASGPLDIGKMYEYVSSVKGLGVKELEDIVYSNAKRIFSI